MLFLSQVGAIVRETLEKLRILFQVQIKGNLSNCVEASDSKFQVMTGKARGKELDKSSIDISSSDSSDEDRRLKGNRTVKNQRNKRKRRYSSTDSSDSYSSDDSDSVSYSSYSGYDSDSGSSETSLSSDYRHKHRKMSRKDKQGFGHEKRKNPRQQRGHKKKSTHRSNRSSGSSSSSQSDHRSSSSSDAKKSDKRSLQTSRVSKRAAVLMKEEAVTRPKIDDHMSTQKNASDENDEASNRELPENEPHVEAKSDKLVDQSPNPDKNLSRNLKGNSDASPRGNPRRELASDPNDIHRFGADRSSPERSPRSKASKPMSNNDQNLSKETSSNAAPKRIRKGRGFTKEFAYVRKYRSPSPDFSPLRSRYNWRYEEERNGNRYSRYRSYTEHSAARHLRGSQRDSSPLRYQSRRARSRSTSPRSARYRAGGRNYSRSPRRSRSPRKPVSDRLGSRLGPQGSGHDAYRRRSRSRSLDSPASKSPGRKQNQESKGNVRDHSSSSISISPGKNGVVSYGDGSPDQ